MKKVKITLGIALALFTGGANSVFGQVGGINGDTTSNKAFSIAVKAYVTPDSAYYAGSKGATLKIAHGYTTVDAAGIDSAVLQGTNAYESGLSIAGANARNDINDKAGKSWDFHSIEAGYRDPNPHPTSEFTPAGSLNSCLFDYNYGRYLIRDTIRLVYNAGTPVVKRVLTVRNDTMSWVLPNHPNQGDLLQVEEFIPYVASGDKKDDKYTWFAYEDDVTSLVDQYSIVAIEYYISVGTSIEGPGGGIPIVINRPFTIETTDPSITTDPIAGQKHYVQSHDPFDITVFGTPGKKIDLKTSIVLLDKPTLDNDGVIGEDGKLVIHFRGGITASTTLTIGYDPDSESGNSAIAADAVWSADGTLYVNAASAGTVSVYSITGQLIKQTTVSGSYTLALSKGLYIVQLNGKAYKVIL